MAETSATTVSVSRLLGVETARHLPSCRDRTETPAETIGLKALALLVLARDTQRDSNRDGVSRASGVAETASRQAVGVRGARTGETVDETPAEAANAKNTENQKLTGVSPCRMLGSETPETPRREVASAVVVGSRGDAGETVSGFANSWGDAEEERAAIVEYDDGILCPWAEGFARLHPDRPPGDVPPKRWVAFIDDIGRFLDSPFCAIAAALGWGPHDLFGCDRDRPFARIDQAGLLWLLAGDKLIALTENTATIERRTGGRQTYRRKPNEPGQVLAWELSGDG